MEWFCEKVGWRKWRVACWLDGYLVSMDHRYSDQQRAEKMARYMNLPQEKRQEIDYAEAYAAWYP